MRLLEGSMEGNLNDLDLGDFLGKTSMVESMEERSERVGLHSNSQPVVWAGTLRSTAA